MLRPLLPPKGGSPRGACPGPAFLSEPGLARTLKSCRAELIIALLAAGGAPDPCPGTTRREGRAASPSAWLHSSHPCPGDVVGRVRWRWSVKADVLLRKVAWPLSFRGQSLPYCPVRWMRGVSAFAGGPGPRGRKAWQEQRAPETQLCEALPRRVGAPRVPLVLQVGGFPACRGHEGDQTQGGTWALAAAHGEPLPRPFLSQVCEGLLPVYLCPVARLPPRAGSAGLLPAGAGWGLAQPSSPKTGPTTGAQRAKAATTLPTSPAQSPEGSDHLPRRSSPLAPRPPLARTVWPSSVVVRTLGREDRSGLKKRI